ncbi:MAG: peptide-methionine (S)-S-oxide reductase MsrA [Pyrinomonadaceae bacterium]
MIKHFGLFTILTSLTIAALASVSPAQEKAVFAGGCFWGVEAVFEHVKGVTDVRSGYAGGSTTGPRYEDVSTGTTGHAESVMVTFDPAKVSYTQLLSVFFSVAHDPTQLNRQGPDHGTQYRSAIFYTDAKQQKLAEDYIAAIEKSKALSSPVVTEVAPLGHFYEAEAYHQNYLKNHPDEAYIIVNDKPKVAALKQKFPGLYVGK